MLKSTCTFLFLLGIGLIPSAADAQNLVTGVDGGLHIRSTFATGQGPQHGLGTLVQPFLRHQVSRSIQGELSLGLGTLRGYDFTTRLIPVDYRVLLYPFSYDRPALLPGLFPGDMYLYAGAGLLKYDHVEIPRPADPLTFDAGPKIRNTELWTFGDNWAFHLPVGVGTAIHLDDETQLVLNAGYQLTSSQRLAYEPSKGLNGYFAMSVGLKFARPTRIFRSSYSAPVRFPIVKTPELAVAPVQMREEPAPARRIVLSEMPQAIRFDVFSPFPKDAYQDSLMLVLQHLQLNPSSILRVNGHTDVSGQDQLNDVLAWERAWQVKQWLLRSGIEKERVRISSFGRTMPLADNSTEVGRSLNRRVDLRLEDGDGLEVTDTSQESASPAPASTLTFGKADMRGLLLRLTPASRTMRVDLDSRSIADLNLLLSWLKENADIRIRIEGQAHGYGSSRTNQFYSLAWASKVQAYLIHQGIAIDRLETVGKGSTDLNSRTATRVNRIDILRIP